MFSQSADSFRKPFRLCDNKSLSSSAISASLSAHTPSNYVSLPRGLRRRAGAAAAATALPFPFWSCRPRRLRPGNLFRPEDDTAAASSSSSSPDDLPDDGVSHPDVPLWLLTSLAWSLVLDLLTPLVEDAPVLLGPASSPSTVASIIALARLRRPEPGAGVLMVRSG